MEIVEAVILGLVQGVTEFLPISSSGHLIFVRNWLGIENEINALAFDAILHLSTTLAVTLYFWKDLWILFQAVLRKMAKLPVNEKDITLFYALAIGTVPAALMGVFLEDYIASFQNTLLVAGLLFIASLFFLYAEWKYYLRPQKGQLTLRKGIKVGLFQALALLPGFSRSGATIAGGMLVGLSRYEASRFSFLLAIPITLGVGIKKLLELLTTDGIIDWTPIYIGAITAGLTAFIVIHFFLAFIRRYTLWPFIWYGLILSLLVGYFALIN